MALSDTVKMRFAIVLICLMALVTSSIACLEVIMSFWPADWEENRNAKGINYMDMLVKDNGIIVCRNPKNSHGL